MARTFTLLTHVAVTALILTCISVFGTLEAGPLSGQRQSEPSNEQNSSGELDSTTQGTTGDERYVAAPNFVSTYLDALKSQVLPNINEPSLDASNVINLDGLQGWSLDDIRAAMDAAALGIDDTTVGQLPTDGQQSQLTVSVEDLYNFNTGYYFVLDRSGQVGDQGDLVSGPNLPEIIGQTALSTIELDIVNLSETGINLSVETSVGLLNDSFFTSGNSSNSSQSIGSRGFRVGGGGLGGGGGGGGSTEATDQGTTLANFILQTIDFMKDNAITIALVVFGFTGVGYVISRFA